MATPLAATHQPNHQPPSDPPAAPTPLAVVSGHQAHSNDANQASFWGSNCTKPDGGGVNDDSYQLPALGPGLAYDQVIVKAGSGSSANTIFDNPAAGSYVWADTNGDNAYNVGGQGGDSQISHIIICTAIVVNPAVTVTPPTCEDNGSFQTTAITGVTYNIPGGATFGVPFTITTTLAQGYVLATGNTGSYTITVLARLTGEQCEEEEEPIEVSPAVTVVPPTCDEDGSFTLAEIGGVTYSFPADWEFGEEFTVTATLANGYILADGADDSFDITVLAQLTGDQCEEQPETGEIKVIKRLCTDIGENNTCNGRENEFNGWEIDFEVFEGTDIEADPIGTITVSLDEGNGSQGQTTDDLEGELIAGETYTVCEVPVLRDPDTDEEVDLIAVPRPDETTGGVNQTEHEDGPCIIVELTPGTNVVQFLDLVAEEEEPDAGTIVIDKVVTGTGASGTEDFAISLTGQTVLALSANDAAVSFEIEIDPEDTYTVSEALTALQNAAGWTLTGIVCTSDVPENGVLADAIGFSLEADETVTCVVTNAFSAPLGPTPGLVIDKVANTETITITGAPGSLVARPSTVTWTLTYTLVNGPVHGAVITDPLPTGFTFIEASSGGALVGNTVTWNLGTLTSSGSVTFRTTVDPVAVPRGVTTNIATIDSTETAPDTGQDGVTVSQTGTQASVSTPSPTPTVRQQVLTSTGVPNTSTLADPGLTLPATIGALMALAAAVLLSANATRERRRR